MKGNWGEGGTGNKGDGWIKNEREKRDIAGCKEEARKGGRNKRNRDT